MEYAFSVARRRRITEANYMSYEFPVQHPSRQLPEHDLIYMTEGEWTIGMGEERFTLRKDDVLILAAGLPHYGIAPCAPGTKTMHIHIALEPEDRIPAGDLPPSGAWLLLPSRLCAAGAPEIRRLFANTINAQKDGDGIRAAVCFDGLLYALNSFYPADQQADLAKSIHDRIVAASHRILKNSELSDSLGVCVKTAETAFRHAYGMSIHQYILKLKIEQAQFYLVNYPAMKLYEIAKNLGFYDEYHLSRRFKQTCGISPSAYRAIHGGKNRPSDSSPF